MNDFEADLRRLAEPTSPQDLSERVASRIAHFDQPGPEPAPRRTLRSYLAWVAAFVGLAIGLGAQLYQLALGELALNLAGQSLASRLDGVVDMVPATPSFVVLGAGLLLYLAGLHALLGTKKPPA